MVSSATALEAERIWALQRQVPEEVAWQASPAEGEALSCPKAPPKAPSTQEASLCMEEPPAPELRRAAAQP